MRKLTEEDALAIALLNLKGQKDKDLMGTAKALQFLKALPNYRSNAKVGAAVGVSGEIVREFLALLDLPSEVQALFQDRQLRLEHGRRLWQLKRARPSSVDDMARAMKGLSAMDSRHLVDYVLKHPELPIPEAKRRVLESKTVVKDEYHVIAILDEADYRRLVRRARASKTTPNDLVTTVLSSWLRSHDD